MTPRIGLVQGTRPEIIKNYPIVSALRRAGVHVVVYHTNQHFLPEMKQHIYENFDYQPDRVLPETYTIGGAINWLQKSFARDGINHVIVNGDTAASLAGGIASLYCDIPLSHVEAGLRSFDPFMLEERNRIMLDSISSLLFAYTSYEEARLLDSPDIRGEVLVEGNTTVDVIDQFRGEFPDQPPLEPYVFVTLHRRELIESHTRMLLAVDALNRVADRCARIIFPVHPRTSQALESFSLKRRLSRNIELIEPQDFVCALRLQSQAAVVLTDSGCVQEEAYLLRVPCVTLRNNTERHLTVEHKANVVSGFSPHTIETLVQKAMRSEDRNWPEIYGSVGVGDRIVERIIERSFGRAPQVIAEVWPCTGSKSSRAGA